MNNTIIINKQGIGQVRIGDHIYSVLKVNGLYNLRCEDFSGKFKQDWFIVENKKRLSTIQKYANEYNLTVIEEA